MRENARRKKQREGSVGRTKSDTAGKREKEKWSKKSWAEEEA